MNEIQSPAALHPLLAHINSLLPINPAYNEPPLFVLLQGPQGSGKSTVAAALASLSTNTHSTGITLPRTVVLSIDDLYLPHAQLSPLGSHNALLRGRGQPGTHDVPLGKHVLDALRRINDPPAAECAVPDELKIPLYDKSAHSGQGDRAPEVDWPSVRRPPPRVGIVVLEGWCAGFVPCSDDELEERWNASVYSQTQRDERRGGRVVVRKEDIQEVNQLLKGYEDLWHYFDTFVQLKPAPPPPTISSSRNPFEQVHIWRLEQEHALRARTGKGMTDTEVQRFVERYEPGYVFFGTDEALERRWGGPRADGKAGGMLRITLDAGRAVVDTRKF